MAARVACEEAKEAEEVEVILEVREVK